MRQKKVPKFSITVLGSGSCVPLPERYPAAYFLRTSVIRENWLVDIGPGSLKHLSDAGGFYKDIDSVFISHIHPDHISDLLPLLQALNYTPNFVRRKPLFVYGSEDVEKYLRCNLELALSVREDFPLQVIVLCDNMEVNRKHWSLRVRRLRHSTITLGFRWDLKGCTLVYGADTEICDELVELAKGADLLILESSFTRTNPQPGHLTTFQAGEIAGAANVKRLLLSHFYPEVAEMGKEERESEVRASGYKGKVIFAEVLMSLEIFS